MIKLLTRLLMGHKDQVNIISDFTRKHQINCLLHKILAFSLKCKKNMFVLEQQIDKIIESGKKIFYILYTVV